MPNLDKANTQHTLVSDLHSWSYVNLMILLQSQATRGLQRADAAYNAVTDERRVLCFRSTRVTLLADIAKWIRSLDETRVYLLFGPAGIGKSTIAQTVAARADEVGYL